jgi:hypothetical protein
LKQAVPKGRETGNEETAMPKKKLSDQALVALIEDLIAIEPHKFDGYLWAARPQSHYFKALGVSQWTLIGRIKKPPFVARTTKIDGKVVGLLRVGEPALKGLNDYKKIMRAMLRNMRDNADPPVLYGTAGEKDAANKAVAKAAKAAAAKGEDAEAAAAIAGAEARKDFKAEGRKEDQMLWGYVRDVVELVAGANKPWPNIPCFSLPKDIEEKLVLRSFKYALSKNGWPFVASAIKSAQQSLGDKLMFLEYPSVSHIRRYWFAVVNAYVTHWQMDGDDGGVPHKHLSKIGGIGAATCPFTGIVVSHAGLTKEMIAMQEAMSPAMAEMAHAKAALKAECKPTSVAGMVEAMKPKYPGYALAKAYQDAKAEDNLNLAAELAAELVANYYSSTAAGEAASQAEAAWEAKTKGATSVKQVLAKFAWAKAGSEPQADEAA